MNEIDLKDLWRKNEDNATLIPTYDIKAILSGKSISPLQKLKRNLRIHMGYGVAGIIFFASLMYFFPYNAVFIGSGILIAISIFFLGQLSVMTKSLEQRIKLQPINLLEALRQQHSLIQSSFKVQETIAIPFYSISILLGMYLGFIYDSSSAEFSPELKTWIIMGIVMVIWTFLAQKIERWMNKKAFGVHLDHIKEIISQLENSVL